MAHYGDGDFCPTAGHGRMFRMRTGGQYCANQEHDSELLGKPKAFTQEMTMSTDTGQRGTGKPAPKPGKPKGPAASTAAARPGKEPQACLCGCGGKTKGGRFIPGHDARYHSRIRILEKRGIGHAEAAEIASRGDLPAEYTTPQPAGLAWPKPVSPKKPRRARGKAAAGPVTAE